MAEHEQDNIFKELRKDHDKQRDFFDELLQTTGDSENRRLVYEDLKSNLKDHARYEERYFYSPLMEEDITVEASRHAVHEHYKIDSMIEKIDDTDFSSPQWLIKLKDLKHLVLHHLEEEEHEFFQIAGKALNETQKQTLGKKYHLEMHS